MGIIRSDSRTERFRSLGRSTENDQERKRLVEDNAGDARLLRETLLEANPHVRLHVVGDGDEAMAFLRYQEPYVNAPRPDVILLDLNLPKTGGLEVLASVKANPWLKTIPLIVLTTSQSPEDIVSSYRLLASCYLAKPAALKEFEKLVLSLDDLWLRRAALPKHMDNGCGSSSLSLPPNE